MRNSKQKSRRTNFLSPGLSVVSQNDWEIRRLRILLLTLVVVEVISVFEPRLFHPWRTHIDFLPQILIGFVFLVLIFTLHLEAQRKMLSEISTALIVANSYVKKLEEEQDESVPTLLDTCPRKPAARENRHGLAIVSRR